MYSPALLTGQIGNVAYGIGPPLPVPNSAYVQLESGYSLTTYKKIVGVHLQDT